MATGILNTGVRTEADAAMALLGEYVDNKSVSLKTSAIIGLGLAYAGSVREDLQLLLLPLVSDDSLSMEIASLAALSLGFVYVGSGDGEIARTRAQMVGHHLERSREIDGLRIDSLKRSARSMSPAVGGDHKRRELMLSSPHAHVSTMESPARGRRLLLFQETSDESFEESLMAGGYGPYVRRSILSFTQTL